MLVVCFQRQQNIQVCNIMNKMLKADIVGFVCDKTFAVEENLLTDLKTSHLDIHLVRKERTLNIDDR